MGLRILVLGLAGWMGVLAGAQTAAPPAKAPVKVRSKAKVAKVPVAVWSSDVMHAFGVLPSGFASSGLAKLTQPQLDALLAGAKPKGTMIACPAANSSGKTRVLLTISGQDVTDAISGEIRTAVGGLNDVTLVDGVEQADATLRVVVQTLTVNQKTIGYTASYVLGTPCTEQTGDKKTAVELKGVLGSTMNAKSGGLAQTLATMMDKELKVARTAGSK